MGDGSVASVSAGAMSIGLVITGRKGVLIHFVIMTFARIVLLIYRGNNSSHLGFILLFLSLILSSFSGLYKL